MLSTESKEKEPSWARKGEDLARSLEFEEFLAALEKENAVLRARKEGDVLHSLSLEVGGKQFGFGTAIDMTVSEFLDSMGVSAEEVLAVSELVEDEKSSIAPTSSPLSDIPGMDSEPKGPTGATTTSSKSSEVVEIPRKTSVPISGTEQFEAEYLGDGKTLYRWKANNKEAFLDRGQKIDVLHTSTKVIEAAMAIACDRGWSSIELTGPSGFRQEAWYRASLAGLNVSGYEPSSKDLIRLKEAKRKLDEAVDHEVCSIAMLP